MNGGRTASSVLDVVVFIALMICIHQSGLHYSFTQWTNCDESLHILRTAVLQYQSNQDLWYCITRNDISKLASSWDGLLNSWLFDELLPSCTCTLRKCYPNIMQIKHFTKILKADNRKCSKKGYPLVTCLNSANIYTSSHSTAPILSETHWKLLW